MSPKTLADFVKTQIADAEWTLTPDVIRRGYSPQIKISDANTLTILIVPRSISQERNDETAWSRLIAVDIGILYKFSHLNDAEIPNTVVDPVADFADELRDYFASPDYEPPDGMDVDAIAHDPLFLPDHLKEHRQYTSVISVTFQEIE